MEVLASLLIPPDATETTGGDPAGPDAEQSAEFAALLFSALSALNSPSGDIGVPIDNGRGDENISVAGSEGEVTVAARAAAQPNAASQDSTSASVPLISDSETGQIPLPAVAPSPQPAAVIVHADWTVTRDRAAETREDKFPQAVRPRLSIEACETHGAPEEPGNFADSSTARNGARLRISTQGTEHRTAPDDPTQPHFTGQGQATARGRVSAPDENLGEIISSIARDRTDGIMPGLKLGHPLQSEKVADPAPAEKPAELSNARAVVFDPGKRQGLSTADAHDRAPTHREHQGWLHQPSDSPAIVGAQVPRGYEIQQDAEAAPKWRPTIERLADDIVSHARLGRKEAVLQLDPPELGKIKIDLRLEDGKLRAQIIAEGRESKQLIEAHLPELRQALAAGRLETAEVRVSQGNWSGLSGNFSQNFHHSPQGRQESGWSFHGTPAAEGERRPAGSASSPARGAGRISMWA